MKKLTTTVLGYITTRNTFCNKPFTRCKEILPEGVWKSDYSASYESGDGGDLFKFKFVDMGGYYEIDILKQPGYNGNAEDGHHTHRLVSARGGHRICFEPDSSVNSIKKAQAIAQTWAEHTQRYRKYGIPFGGRSR